MQIATRTPLPLRLCFPIQEAWKNPRRRKTRREVQPREGEGVLREKLGFWGYLKLGWCERGARWAEDGLPREPQGPADAMRHCVWLCKMVKWLGEPTARFVANNHEEWTQMAAGSDKDTRDPDRAMDEANNEEGIACANKGLDCEQCCGHKLRHGHLYWGVPWHDVGEPEKYPWPCPPGEMAEAKRRYRKWW